MELYLDSANINEIEEAFKLGFLTGLTTTPTFMHRDGVTDIDGLILKLADMVPILQVEALGQTAEEIVAEAHRQLEMGLKKETSVFKIPVSLEGVKACKILTDQDIMVNVHLVYTLQQAYMAMEAGATYVCPLVGRLQDQGHDALELVSQCVEAVNYYGYDTKIMFSSVRYPEHIRNALNAGVHVCTVPWKVMTQLTENNFTTVGTDQFFEHTKLMTNNVKSALRDVNPTVSETLPIPDAIFKMTEYGFGSITVLDAAGNLKGVFTDGDLRRLIGSKGDAVMNMKLSDLEYGKPKSVDAGALLNVANDIFKSTQVDTLLVLENGETNRNVRYSRFGKIKFENVDNSLEHTQHIFEAKGGVFITPPFVLAKKLKNIKAILFDWDGVFNEGNKGGGNHSGFSEIDSMGTNMLRFSSWLKQEESMLISAIVTGANNEVSLDFAAREHFDKVYFGVTDKKQALKHLVEDCGLKKEEIAFFLR